MTMLCERPDSCNGVLAAYRHISIQKGLPDILRCLFSVLGEQSGYAWQILGGGPDVSEPNGQIRTISYNFGKTRSGESFNQWAPDWLARVAQFKHFCHAVFREYSNETA